MNTPPSEPMKDREILTVEQAIAILQKLPPQARLYFQNCEDPSDNEIKKEEGNSKYLSEYSGDICSIEYRIYADGYSEVILHESAPQWDRIGVTVVSENETFAETNYNED